MLCLGVEWLLHLASTLGVLVALGSGAMDPALTYVLVMVMGPMDVEVGACQMGELAVDKHVKYIISVEKKKESFESVVMEHLRLNGAYWGLTTLDLLGKLDAVDKEEVISWIMKCQHESGLCDGWMIEIFCYAGGFAGNIGHDPHILYTISAVQVLALFDKLDVLDVDKVSNCILIHIAGLQNEDGSFSGDMWGEVDTRFSYIAICCLSILQRLDKINVDKAVNYIVSCKNLDGGFGCTPGGESHAGQNLVPPEFRASFVVICRYYQNHACNFFLPSSKMNLPVNGWINHWLFVKSDSNIVKCLSAAVTAVFCCVGALAIAGALHHVDKDLLGWWLCERQVKSGGLNGRPEKLPDVCYSWWVLSSLIMIDRVHWINKEKLVKYILDCQDTENGGISDRPDDAVDVFHTYFGVAGLSLLEYPGVKAIDPAYALPVDVVNRIFLSK
ncbi:hypothetical protein Pint_31057 [Pistacia integerrima]|uniref:Uncharacterized protein n=1 Tax=Pistacia integerrima TaxID=434235 RepID=A0ACC0XM11_9ROSI|nr:hypothetical protein Pint_31057 [Pistacia integerrima]